MESAASDRVRRALGGAIVSPVVEGLTFVDPMLLQRPGGSMRSPASALARAAADLRLDFAFVPSWEPWALEAVATLAAVGVAALWAVPGVVWPTLEHLGVAEGLRWSVREPARMADALDVSFAIALDGAASGIGAGARGLVVADDMAGSAGPLLSASWLGSEAFPRLARIVSLAEGAGLPVVLHCDGDARSLFALARDAGFAGLHGDCGGAAGIVGALEAARATGIALLGGLATSELNDPDRAARAGTGAASLAGGGGLLVADDGGLTGADQVAALFAALRAVGSR